VSQIAVWTTANMIYFPITATEALHQSRARREAGCARMLHTMRFWRKKVGWFLFTTGAPACKRALDIGVALALLIAGLPVFLVVALLIKMTDGGPILFWQTRVGRWGQEFAFPKFRSMVVDAERRKALLIAQNDHKVGVTFKMREDPRITWIGRIIRKLSIDELPQLWCVLRGDMSLVGPRPPVPQEVAQYTLAERRRLDAVPGLTCIWQVSGRSNLPFPRQVELDVQYIQQQSFALDMQLLLRTIPAVLSGKGAY
jgi:lipopolysaccharide/colanic/teichoic acid biosynthesis glycosyltransferase